jgi:hypothetical protein
MVDERDPVALAVAERLAHFLTIALADTGRVVFVWDGQSIPPPLQPGSLAISKAMRSDTRQAKSGLAEDHLRRVRRICGGMPEATEKLSHGEPTFFVRKKVFAMFANNHHNDGHVAVWLPAGPGVQAMLVSSEPQKFFKPPYVGVRGWIGVELERIGDDELACLIREAWRLVAPKTLKTRAARA